MAGNLDGARAKGKPALKSVLALIGQANFNLRCLPGRVTLRAGSEKRHGSCW